MRSQNRSSSLTSRKTQQQQSHRTHSSSRGGAAGGGLSGAFAAAPPQFMTLTSSSSAFSVNNGGLPMASPPPPSSSMTVQHATDDARALEMEAHQHDVNGRDMDAIRMMERALLLRLHANANAAAAASSSPINGSINATAEASMANAAAVETARAAERLVVKCNAVAVAAFKRDDYNYAFDLLKNAMRLTEAPSGGGGGGLSSSAAAASFYTSGGGGGSGSLPFSPSSSSSSSSPFALFPQKRIALRGTTLNNLACLERRRGRLVAALEYIRDSVDNSKQQSAASFLNLSAILNEMGNSAEAVASAKRAISLLERNAAQYHNNNSNIINKARGGGGGGATANQNMPPGGEFAADSGGSPVDEYNNLIAIAYHNLGTALESTADLQEAIRAFEKGLTAALETIGPDAATTRSIRQHLEKLVQRGGGGGGNGLGGGGPVGPLFLPSVRGGGSSPPPPSSLHQQQQNRGGGVNILASTPYNSSKLKPPGTARDYGVSSPRTTNLIGGGGGGLFSPLSTPPRPTTSPSVFHNNNANANNHRNNGGLFAASTSAAAVGRPPNGNNTNNNNHLNTNAHVGPSGKLVGLNSADVFASIAEAKRDKLLLQQQQQNAVAGGGGGSNASTPRAATLGNNNNNNNNQRPPSGTSTATTTALTTANGRLPKINLAAIRGGGGAGGGGGRPALRSGSAGGPSSKSTTAASTSAAAGGATSNNNANAASKAAVAAGLAGEMSLGEYVQQRLAAAGGGTGASHDESSSAAATQQNITAITMQSDIVTFATNRLGALLTVEAAFERKYVAARRIQRLFRYVSARREADDRRRVRDLAAFNQIRREDDAAIIIQRNVRLFLKAVHSRDALLHRNRRDKATRHKAALVIQLVARRWLSRRELLRRRNFQRKYAKSLQILQNFFRKTMAIRKVQRMRLAQSALIAKQLDNEKRSKAATDIQRVYRNALSASLTQHARGERRIAKERDAARRRHANACVIQHMWRAFICKQNLLRNRIASRNRGLLAAAAQEERYAVLMLQGLANGLITRRLVTGPMLAAFRERAAALNTATNHSAATRIQCLVRGAFARALLKRKVAVKRALVRYHSLEASAVLLQSVGQGFLARQFLGVECAIDAARAAAAERIAVAKAKAAAEANARARAEAEAEALRQIRSEEEAQQRAIHEAILAEKAKETALIAAQSIRFASEEMTALYESLAALEIEELDTREEAVLFPEASDRSALLLKGVAMRGEAAEAQQRRLDIEMLRAKGMAQLEEEAEALRQLRRERGEDPEGGDGEEVTAIATADAPSSTAAARSNADCVDANATLSKAVLAAALQLKPAKTLTEISRDFGYSVGYMPNKAVAASSPSAAAITGAITGGDDPLPPRTTTVVSSARKKAPSAANPPTREVTASRSFLFNEKKENGKQNQTNDAADEAAEEAERAPIPPPHVAADSANAANFIAASLRPPVEKYAFSDAYYLRKRETEVVAAITIQSFLRGRATRAYYAAKQREQQKYVDLLVERDGIDDEREYGDEDAMIRFNDENNEKEKNLIRSSCEDDAKSKKKNIPNYPEDILARRFGQKFGELHSARDAVGGEAVIQKSREERLKERLEEKEKAAEAKRQQQQAADEEESAAAVKIQGLASIIKAKKERVARAEALKQKHRDRVAKEEAESDDGNYHHRTHSSSNGKFVRFDDHDGNAAGASSASSSPPSVSRPSSAANHAIAAATIVASVLSSASKPSAEEYAQLRAVSKQVESDDDDRRLPSNTYKKSSSAAAVAHALFAEKVHKIEDGEGEVLKYATPNAAEYDPEAVPRAASVAAAGDASVSSATGGGGGGAEYHRQPSVGGVVRFASEVIAADEEKELMKSLNSVHASAAMGAAENDDADDEFTEKVHKIEGGEGEVLKYATPNAAEYDPDAVPAAPAAASTIGDGSLHRQPSGGVVRFAPDTAVAADDDDDYTDANKDEDMRKKKVFVAKAHTIEDGEGAALVYTVPNAAEYDPEASPAPSALHTHSGECGHPASDDDGANASGAAASSGGRRRSVAASTHHVVVVVADSGEKEEKTSSDAREFTEKVHKIEDGEGEVLKYATPNAAEYDPDAVPSAIIVTSPSNPKREGSSAALGGTTSSSSLHRQPSGVRFANNNADSPSSAENATGDIEFIQKVHRIEDGEGEVLKYATPNAAEYDPEAVPRAASVAGGGAASEAAADDREPSVGGGGVRFPSEVIAADEERSYVRANSTAAENDDDDDDAEFTEKVHKIEGGEGEVLKYATLNAAEYDPDAVPAAPATAANDDDREAMNFSVTLVVEEDNDGASDSDNDAERSAAFAEKVHEIEDGEGLALGQPLPQHDYDPTVAPAAPAIAGGATNHLLGVSQKNDGRGGNGKLSRTPSFAPLPAEVVEEQRRRREVMDAEDAAEEKATFEAKLKAMKHNEGAALRERGNGGGESVTDVHDYDPTAVPERSSRAATPNPSPPPAFGASASTERHVTIPMPPPTANPFATTATPSASREGRDEEEGQRTKKALLFKQHVRDFDKNEFTAATLTLQRFAKAHCIPSSPTMKPSRADRDAILGPLREAKRVKLQLLADEADDQEDIIRDIIVGNLPIQQAQKQSSSSFIPKPPPAPITSRAGSQQQQQPVAAEVAASPMLGSVTTPISSTSHASPTSTTTPANYNTTSDSDSAASVIQRAFKGHSSRKIAAAKRSAQQDKWRQISEVDDEAARTIQDGLKVALATKKMRRELKSQQEALREARRLKAEAEDAAYEREMALAEQRERERGGGGAGGVVIPSAAASDSTVSSSSIAVVAAAHPPPHRHVPKAPTACRPGSSSSHAAAAQQQQQQAPFKRSAVVGLINPASASRPPTATPNNNDNDTAIGNTETTNNNSITNSRLNTAGSNATVVMSSQDRLAFEKGQWAPVLPPSEEVLIDEIGAALGMSRDANGSDGDNVNMSPISDEGEEVY